MFAGSLGAIPFVVWRLPTDMFVRADEPAKPPRHPVLRLLGRVLRNLVGLVFLISGAAMLVLPGQGILAIVLGLSLLDFPHKRRVVLWIVRRSTVLRAINWIRMKGKKAPLEVPDESEDDGSGRGNERSGRR